MVQLTCWATIHWCLWEWTNDYGVIGDRRYTVRSSEDFMLCKNEAGSDPGRCLKEGRRVTRCATDL